MRVKVWTSWCHPLSLPSQTYKGQLKSNFLIISPFRILEVLQTFIGLSIRKIKFLPEQNILVEINVVLHLAEPALLFLLLAQRGDAQVTFNRLQKRYPICMLLQVRESRWHSTATLYVLLCLIILFRQQRNYVSWLWKHSVLFLAFYFFLIILEIYLNRIYQVLKTISAEK